MEGGRETGRRRAVTREEGRKDEETGFMQWGARALLGGWDAQHLKVDLVVLPGNQRPIDGTVRQSPDYWQQMQRQCAHPDHDLKEDVEQPEVAGVVDVRAPHTLVLRRTGSLAPGVGACNQSGGDWVAPS